MRGFRKLIGIAAVTAGALISVGGAQAAPAPAIATGVPLNHDTSPWKTGVPYLAWRGENVRIVVCDTADRMPLDASNHVEAKLMDFSGPFYNADPQILFGSTAVFQSSSLLAGGGEIRAARNCAAIQVVSDKAGLAQFKLTVYFGGENIPANVLQSASGQYFRTYDVNVIWMALKQADLTGGNTNVTPGDSPQDGEISATGDLGNKGHCLYIPALAKQPGNPKTLCTATSNRQHVTAVVKGSFPLDRNYPADWGLAGVETWTLPDDWSKLAPHLALNGDVSAFDIHDDNATTKGHFTLSQCPLNVLDATELNNLTNLDAVDNCFGFDTSRTGVGDRYSRITGDLNSPALYVVARDSGGSKSEPVAGPFDPNLPQYTWLPDGKVDQWDAPMPPAEVTFSIDQPLSGGFGGVGYLAARHKTDVYRRNQMTGTPPALVSTTAAHELYAPFYFRHLVPTMRDGDTSFNGAGATNGLDLTENSGITGAIHVQPIDDTLVPRPTFLVPGNQESQLDSEYTDWQSVWDQTRGSLAYTHCTWQKDPKSGNLLPYPLPYGVKASKVYTDEHGEAQIDWVPGNGYNLDALFPNPLDELNANGGCDLNPFNGHEIGFANVSATANYPYELSNLGVTAPTKAFFSVKSKWSKTLTAYPKSKTANAGWIFVAHGQDLNGQPFRNEIVCFTWDASTSTGGIIYHSPSLNGTPVPIPGTTLTIGGPTQDQGHAITDPVYGFGRQCTRTDDNGNAALEIGGSAVTNSVTAWFENEGINVSIASKAGAFPAAAPSTTPLSDTAVVKALIASGTKSGAVSAAAIRHRLVVQRPKIAARSIKLARVVHLVGHHAQMQVFVKGKPGSVALRITITNGKGKSHTVTRIVRVNKLATIKHLRVSTAARISVKIA